MAIITDAAHIQVLTAPLWNGRKIIDLPDWRLREARLDVHNRRYNLGQTADRNPRERDRLDELADAIQCEVVRRGL